MVAQNAQYGGLAVAASIVADFDRFGFRVMLSDTGALTIQDLSGRQRPRTPSPQLLALFSEHSDEIGRWLQEGGTI